MRIIDVIVALVLFFIVIFSSLLIITNTLENVAKEREYMGIKKILETISIKDCFLSNGSINIEMENFNEIYNYIEIYPFKEDWIVDFRYRVPVLLNGIGNFSITIRFEYGHSRNFSIIVSSSENIIPFEASCEYYNNYWIKSCNISFSSNTTLVFIYYDITDRNTLIYNKSLNLINLSRNYKILPEEINVYRSIGKARGKEYIPIIRYINCYEIYRIACVGKNYSFCTKFFNESNIDELFNLSSSENIYEYDAVFFFSNLSEDILSKVNATILYDFYNMGGDVISFYQNSYEFLSKFNINKLDYYGYGIILHDNHLIVNYPNEIRDIYFYNSLKSLLKSDYKYYYPIFILDYIIRNDSLICQYEECWNVTSSPNVRYEFIDSTINIRISGNKYISLLQEFMFNESYYNNLSLLLRYSVTQIAAASSLRIFISIDNYTIYKHFCEAPCQGVFDIEEKYYNFLKYKKRYLFNISIYHGGGRSDISIENVTLVSEYYPIGFLLIENYSNGILILITTFESEDLVENIRYYITRKGKSYILKTKIYYLK